MIFEILIEPEAIADIQKGIDWYNEQQIGLGEKFYTDIKSTLKKVNIESLFSVDMTTFAVYHSRLFLL